MLMEETKGKEAFPYIRKVGGDYARQTKIY